MLVRGDRLSPALREEALRRFVHRWTHENMPRVRHLDVRVQPISDAEWLRAHAFYITRRGTFDRRYTHCVPEYFVYTEPSA